MKGGEASSTATTTNDNDIQEVANGTAAPFSSGCEGEIFGGYFTVEWITTAGGGDSASDGNQDPDPQQDIKEESPGNATSPSTHNEGAGISYFACIAARDIPQHTLIHQERLTLQGEQIWKAMDCYESGEHACQQDDDAYLQDICGLSLEKRTQLWKLHDQRHEGDGSSPSAMDNSTPRASRRRLMGIVYSNAFCNIELGSEPCLFVGATSRFNHSCRPNVGFSFGGYCIRLFTTRNVQQGEELCLCYSDVAFHHSTRVRKIFLKHKYQFDCQCAACFTASPQSDARRRRVGRLAQHLALVVDGANFLYDDTFEQKVRQIVREESVQDDNDLYHGDVATDKSRQLDQLIEYMELLRIEGLDCDQLQCSELAYDLSIAIQQQQQRQSLSLPRSSNTGSLIFDVAAATTTSSSNTESTAASASSNATRDPRFWAAKTLALYHLHKGLHHTSTKTFQIKLQSHGIELSDLNGGA